MPDLLTSAAAARLLGVGVSAVKRWADGGVLPCVRTAGGHRRFHRRDVEAMRHAANVDRWQPWFLALLGPGDVHAVLALLFAARAERGSWCAVAAYAGGLLEEIGERWATGTLSVAEEHVATALLQRALALAAETVPLAVDAPRCLLATAEGDAHTVGLSLAELCLREHGWRSEWLGAHTRAADIRERLSGAPMVALSASGWARERRVLASQVRTVGAACQRAGSTLVLGGTGRWPDPPPFGHRVETWEAFHEFLRRRSTAHRPPRA